MDMDIDTYNNIYDNIYNNMDAMNMDAMNMDTDCSELSSQASCLTEHTTAQECLDDIDISSYMLADNVNIISESLNILLNSHDTYEKLHAVCLEIGSRCEPNDYFEEIYKMLDSIFTSPI